MTAEMAKRRLVEREFILRTFAMELGYENLTHKLWESYRADLATVLPTTWDELVAEGLLERFRRRAEPPAFRLTPSGWREGLRLSGMFASSEFRERCVALVTYFESRRRFLDVSIGREQIAKSFPADCVFNVLRADVLAAVVPGKHMNATPDGSNLHVEVPSTFGMSIVDVARAAGPRQTTVPCESRTPAPPLEPPADSILWVLTKGERRAQLAAREHPVGIELRVSMDGGLILSEVVRPLDDKEPRATAEHHRAAFLERGWVAGESGAP